MSATSSSTNRSFKKRSTFFLVDIEMPSSPLRSQYEDFMRHVDSHGVFKADRTGTGTKSVFGYQMRFDLN